MIKKVVCLLAAYAIGSANLSASALIKFVDYEAGEMRNGVFFCMPARLIEWTEQQVEILLAQDGMVSLEDLTERLKKNEQCFVLQLRRGYTAPIAIGEWLETDFSWGEEMDAIATSVKKAVESKFEAEKTGYQLLTLLRGGLGSLTQEGYCVIS